MKIAASIFSAFIAGTITASAFVAPRTQTPVAFTRSSDVSIRAASGALKGMSDELDIPCDDECAVGGYADLPPSVKPGVLSGQAMVDLLQHAKANGTFVLFTNVFGLDFIHESATVRLQCCTSPRALDIPMM
jgi:hypothetical protein